MSLAPSFGFKLYLGASYLTLDKIKRVQINYSLRVMHANQKRNVFQDSASQAGRYTNNKLWRMHFITAGCHKKGSYSFSRGVGCV